MAGMASTEGETAGFGSTEGRNGWIWLCRGAKRLDLALQRGETAGFGSVEGKKWLGRALRG